MQGAGHEIFSCFRNRTKAVDNVVAQVSNRFQPNATNFWGARPRGSIPKGLHLSPRVALPLSQKKVRDKPPVIL